ncbi:MAG: hybrid sensor histidine kinase/response regulator [Bacteroidales bacterium]
MPHKILIIDDQISFINYMVEVLEKAYPSYEIFQTTDPRKAYDIGRLELPNLIILDWAMPGLSGIELMKQLKADEILKDIPVIMCTGVMTKSAHLQEAFAAGAVDFIRKPIDELELIARVNSVMQLSDSFREIKTLLAHREKLFSIVAHDLRGPIGNLAPMMDVILSQPNLNLDESSRALLESSRETVRDTVSMLEDILLWANNQRNRLQFEFQLQDLVYLLRSQLPFWKTMALSKKIEIKIEAPQQAYAYFDYNSVKTILRNLVNNAIKFSHEGGTIFITIQPGIDTTYVSVKDEGVGINPENLSRIFNTGEHFSTYGTSGERGSGLGLLLCRELIERNKGEIGVESIPGQGSNFFFSLPNHDPDEIH